MIVNRTNQRLESRIHHLTTLFIRRDRSESNEDQVARFSTVLSKTSDGAIIQRFSYSDFRSAEE